MNPSVSVCFPAYNEEGDIRSVLEEAHELLSGSGLEYEILVCDDGSTDATGEILDELAGRIPLLTAFHNERNRGIRYTFEFLYRQATKEFVFLNSTDRQWPTACLFELYPLTSEYDIVIARRVSKYYSIFRSLVSYGYNALPRWLFGVQTHDAGAVKLVRREIIERIPLISRSPFTEAERLIRAQLAGYRVGQLTVETRPRELGVATGSMEPRVLLTALWDVVRVWFDVRLRRRRSPTPPGT